MATNVKSKMEAGTQDELFKKLLLLELFKLGVPQGAIAKKMKMSKSSVNEFLKGITRGEQNDGNEQ